MENIGVLQDYIGSKDITVTDIARMKYSGGVMNLADIDDKFRVRLDRVWTGYWTKKWKELSTNDFAEWVRPKIIKYVNSLPHDESPSYYDIREIARG